MRFFQPWSARTHWRSLKAFFLDFYSWIYSGWMETNEKERRKGRNVWEGWKQKRGIGKEGNEEIVCVPSRYMLLYAIESWSFIAQLCHVLMKQVFTTWTTDRKTLKKILWMTATLSLETRNECQRLRRYLLRWLILWQKHICLCSSIKS